MISEQFDFWLKTVRIKPGEVWRERKNKTFTKFRFLHAVDGIKKNKLPLINMLAEL